MAKSNMVAVRGKNTPVPPLYENDISKSISLIEARKDEIIHRLREGSATDVVTADLTNTMLQAVVNILPSVEKAALSSSKGVYPLEKLLGMARELAHDLRQSSDRNQMRLVIMGQIIDPALLRFAQEQITQLNALERRVRNDPQSMEFVAKMKSNVAESVNNMRIKTSDALDAYFGGDGGAKGIMDVMAEEQEIYTPDDGAVADELKKAAAKKKGAKHVR
jgi:hypothetical protein